MITDEQLDAIDQASYDEIDEFDWAYVKPEIVRALTAEVRQARKDQAIYLAAAREMFGMAEANILLASIEAHRGS